MKKLKACTLRTIVAFAVLALVAVGYFTAGGIGNLSGFGWDAFSVLCPLGYVESLVAGKTFVPRAFLSFVLVIVAIVLLGRVFCAWICPMPTLQRLIPGVRRKNAQKRATEFPDTVAREDGARLAAKPRRVRFDSRFGVLLGAAASAAIFGFPVFCLICPVGLTFATVLLVMRLFAFGDVTWAVVVVPLVLLAEVVFLRRWCGRFCPLGAFISLVSGANRTLRPHVDNASCLYSSKGTHCFACSKACPEHIDVRRPELSAAALANCTKCRECTDACPARAITFPVLPKAEEPVAARECVSVRRAAAHDADEGR